MSQKLIGFYGSRQTAEQVEDDLINAGFDHDDVNCFSGSEGPGLWQEIKEFFGFADESDRQIYAEAARRGQAAVVVTLDDADAPARVVRSRSCSATTRSISTLRPNSGARRGGRLARRPLKPPPKRPLRQPPQHNPRRASRPSRWSRNAFRWASAGC